MKEFDVRPFKSGFCPWALCRRELSVSVVSVALPRLRMNQTDKILRTASKPKRAFAQRKRLS